MQGVSRMHRFTLYETASRYYIVGIDISEERFRVLQIERTTEANQLNVIEDDVVYTKIEMSQLLSAIGDGNKASGGGLKTRFKFWGLLGFVRFTGPYYMMLITKRSQVALIGGHYIYQVGGTELISLSVQASLRYWSTDSEETRLLGILHSLDLSRSFYFSYSYDITRTLQDNIRRERLAMSHEMPESCPPDHNIMFVWNQHLLSPILGSLRSAFDWCLSIIHGFVDQATLSVYGRTVHLSIIARRSQLFAGARFLKRGANDLGHVANDVETEQIVSDMLTTPFHAPGPRLFANPNYTSYVQHRGSIPLHWSQDNSGVSPKPGINLNLVDPFYTAAGLHFNNLFERYGAPLYVLNLVKSRERTPRESILLKEYTKAISYLNQFLPSENKIKYKAWDMSRASKSQDQDVIDTLESIAQDVLESTGLFKNGPSASDGEQIQCGIARTNCIDCLDRTNAAQFVIGKRALGHQLHALGIIDTNNIDYDTDAVNLFTHMFHDHGDTIAIQYGGSHLVNTMETYRKINQWTSQSRDMVESFKRYYNNSFLDRQRQEAYNLFLGYYTYVQGQPMLWDLPNDYYLHHTHPQIWAAHQDHRYSHWFDPKNFRERALPPAPLLHNDHAGRPLSYFDDYWLEIYRPLTYSSLAKLFCFKMNSSLSNIPFKYTREGKYDLSPFKIREKHEHQAFEKLVPRKAVTIANSPNDATSEASTRFSEQDFSQERPIALPLWLQDRLHSPPKNQGVRKEMVPRERYTDEQGAPYSDKKTLKDKAAITQWTLGQFFSNSLDPQVTSTESREYQRYIDHPLNLPLVVSAETPLSTSVEVVKYVQNVAIHTIAEADILQDDIADLHEFLKVGEEPLTVSDADAGKKRYKAYRQWVKGKSLFKQRVDL